jgi:hypothetical protein
VTPRGELNSCSSGPLIQFMKTKQLTSSVARSNAGGMLGLDTEEFKRLHGTASSTPSPTLLPICGRNLLTIAAEKYLSNCEKRGLSAKTIRKYRAAVDPFVQHCGVTYVDECREFASLSDQITAVNLLGRRMVDSVLLIQALGGGWDRSIPPILRPLHLPLTEPVCLPIRHCSSC